MAFLTGIIIMDYITSKPFTIIIVIVTNLLSRQFRFSIVKYFSWGYDLNLVYNAYIDLVGYLGADGVVGLDLEREII